MGEWSDLHTTEGDKMATTSGEESSVQGPYLESANEKQTCDFFPIVEGDAGDTQLNYEFIFPHLDHP